MEVLGSFISDDYYFFFDKDALHLLEHNHVLCGSFVCYKSKQKLVRLMLIVKVDRGEKGRPPSSSIYFDGISLCRVAISSQDFHDWFIKPTDHVRDQGPPWRFASCNVYIKTENSKEYEQFKNNILAFLSQVPDKPRPNYEMIRKLKKRKK